MGESISTMMHGKLELTCHVFIMYLSKFGHFGCFNFMAE